MRDAGRAGFRRSVVGAIFFVSRLSIFFEDRLAKLFDGGGQAKRACRVYLNKIVYKNSNSS